MTAAHLFLAAFLATSTLLVIALGGNASVVRENRRLRTALARAEASRATALHIAGERGHVHPSQRGDLRVVRGGAS